MKYPKYYPYEKDENLKILFEDKEFCVVFGEAQDSYEGKSVAIKWLITKDGKYSKVGYPKRKYVRIYNKFVLAFLNELLNHDNADKVAVKNALGYFENLFKGEK